MFTGIIQDIATVRSVPGPGGGRFAVATRLATGDITDIKLGDSIAVHGPCLTVIEHVPGRLTFDVSPETLRRSSLLAMLPGARVHLERALRVSDRLDGHIVQGHVDGVGRLVSKTVLGAEAGWELGIELPADLLPYVVPKGSVALDGVSLTIATLHEARIGVAVVPHTGRNTTLVDTPIGHPINVETDVLGRYVARLLAFAGVSAGDRGAAHGGAHEPARGLSLEALARGGFLDR